MWIPEIARATPFEGLTLDGFTSYRLAQKKVTTFGLTGSRMMGGFMIGASYFQMGEFFGRAGGNAAPNLLQKPK